MFDLATIQATWETLPKVHLYFADDEGGWAMQLDAQHYCLANQPFTETYTLFDVVTVREEDGRRFVDQVVQRFLPTKVVVLYSASDTPTDEATQHYAHLRATVRAAGGFVEGWTLGIACCAFPADVDGCTLLEEIDIAGLTYAPQMLAGTPL
jgi:hypothetical protein